MLSLGTHANSHYPQIMSVRIKGCHVGARIDNLHGFKNRTERFFRKYSANLQAY